MSAPLRRPLPWCEPQALLQRLLADLERQHRAGLFSGTVGGYAEPFPYRLRVTWGDHSEDIEVHEVPLVGLME